MVGFFGFMIFHIPLAVATNLQTLFVARFLAGAFGSAPLAIVAGMYVDFWDTIDRGVATMGYAAAVFVRRLLIPLSASCGADDTQAGPTIGPVIGSFTVKNPVLGWRWTA